MKRPPDDNEMEIDLQEDIPKSEPEQLRDESHAVYRLSYKLVDALRLSNFRISLPDLFVAHNLLWWLKLSLRKPFVCKVLYLLHAIFKRGLFIL